MDFKHNREMLNGLMEQYFVFMRGNPEGTFPVFQTPYQEAAKAGQMTKDALGADALDNTYGVKAGDFVSFFTGNSPSSPERAAFLSSILTNWTTFFGWMQAYLAHSESGFTIVYHEGEWVENIPASPGFWMAVGPGFHPGSGQPIGQGLTETEALADLLNKMGREG